MALANLVGFASLPADTLAEGPPSGADDGSIDAVLRINPITANGRIGPFDGQPIQGFSGVQFAPGSDGNTFWFLSDNGFGSQSNSTDYLLRLYQVDPNFSGTEAGDGSVEVQGFVQLSDPNNLIPFDIVNEGSSERLLTGGDFDIESFVVTPNGDIWVGEEFGPFLLRFDSNGVLQAAPIATPSFVELNTLNGQEPLVIAHRGASGDFPEHTLEAYQAAIATGADFIEPDLAITSDGVLIARHEPTLAQVELDENGEIRLDADGNPIVKQDSTLTTNIADLPQFADRLTVKNLDGVPTGGWFAEDFTFAELEESVRARQSRDFRDQSFNDLFKIPSLEQVIELVQQVEAETGVKVGIYPETKHPTFFDQQGLALEEPLIQTLLDTGFTDPNRIFIQSFEFQNLIELQGQLEAAGLGNVPLVQLYGNTTDSANPASGFSVPFDIRFNVAAGNDLEAIYGAEFLAAVETPLSTDTIYSDLDSAAFLQVISDLYAEGAGPWKNNILLRERLETPVDGNGDGVAEITTQLTGEVTSFLADAHAAGLQVHPYTVRDEERFLTLNPDGTPQTPEDEVAQLIQLGFDGFFTDFTRTADGVRDRLVADAVRSPQNPDFDFNSLNGQRPLVIAHRGASGDFPEHTLEAYRAAIYQGADFIEPDLAITSDGVLIARHEPTLAQVELDENGDIVRDATGNPVVLQNTTLTTNIADLPEFADRLTVKNLDGALVGGWFAEDFTLAEIKTMRAVQSRDSRSDAFDGLFEIPTLAEVIELVQELSPIVGRDIGIYPETKHPTFFDEQGLSLEAPLVQTLVDTEFTDRDRIFIQSFEIANLLELRSLLEEAGIGNIPLVQLFGDTNGSFINSGGGGFSVPFDLVANADLSDDEKATIYGDLLPFLDFANPGYDALANAAAITQISAYADGIGPWKNNILIREPLTTPVDGNGDGVAEITTQLTGEVVPLIDFAHQAGLQIHPYTLRDEENFLTLTPEGTPQTTGEEFLQLFELGVDGVFTDFPRTGSTVLEGLIPDSVEAANLASSRGYEGMAFSPDGTTLYPMLEGTVFGDPAGSVRIYEVDVATSEFTDLVGFYQLDVPNHAIGDLTPINDNEFLVIERDGRQGEAAEFKKIFKIDFSDVDDAGFVAKEEVVDLLNINDPNDLNGDGETTFSFPFVTIEDVLVLDETTILVANDNNYPFSIGRDFSGEAIDNNEIIQLELATPLNLDDRLGVAGQTSGPAVAELIDLTGIDGEVTVNVTATREANFDNVLKFYETDAAGTVAGLRPNEAGYEQAVAANLLDAELFVGNLTSIDASLSLMGGTYYAPALLIEGDVNNLATIADATLGSSRIQREGNVWGFEDLTDNDFNDFVLTLNSVEPVIA
ncbi:glycerophosphoryl diester phosphodiesterase [Leptolyngbya sp. Heron Island J]|uniref:glycerophosphodiester phosphodiesterase family protein n=1 Tax=Leptolyngbya sp. Heron Island J TaxID=1385935 RepID=UPI0003B97CD8|nr:glycerophosphodiester phosphodiesterase family protein [Leptolyngbya sp. Heron Island J]ESA33965.1 glycerophosphoryl diester phosphodiesterase [Leptolyngbya sp. Heron Island J]